ncbi:MAG: Stp1/IreP family PP2C-type Ser/Thr phosphatase [Lachnospiraceae bacterium]|nr:Stp1/IreP family PP2C-type Ser/Thr phosphatase [Lachnospiraceae bacterium]
METFAKTDVGRKREINQDYIYLSDKKIGSFQNLYIVADGMGGHKAGDHASKLCVESMVSFIKNTSIKTPVLIFEEALSYANSKVYEASITHENYRGMGTTAVAATFTEDTVYIANIGDSRLYRISGDISQITTDHSLVEEMVKQGDLTHSQARLHPQKNIITRALGIESTIKADFFEIKYKKGDYFLLCTDGLSNMVEDYDISYTVKHAKSVKEAVESLVNKANENGGTDNISVMLIKA